MQPAHSRCGYAITVLRPKYASRAGPTFPATYERRVASHRVQHARAAFRRVPRAFAPHSMAARPAPQRVLTRIWIPYEQGASRFRERNTGRSQGIAPVGVHTLALCPPKRRAARMRDARQRLVPAYLRRAHAHSTGLAFADLQVRTVLDPMCFPAYVGSTLALEPLQMRPCYCAGHPPVCPSLALGGLLRPCAWPAPYPLLYTPPAFPARSRTRAWPHPHIR